MKTLVAGFAVAAALFIGAQDDDAGKKDRAKLRGTWKITRFETPKGPADTFAGATLTFDEGGTIEMRKGDESKKGKYQLNAAGKPKEITLTTEDNKDLPGIYQLEKDALKLCLPAGPGAGRPSEFAAPEGGMAVLITLEREKKE